MSRTRGAWGPGLQPPAVTAFGPVPGARAVHLEAPAGAPKLARLCPARRCPLASPAAGSEAGDRSLWTPGVWEAGAATKGPPCWAVYSESSTPQGRTCWPGPGPGLRRDGSGCSPEGLSVPARLPTAARHAGRSRESGSSQPQGGRPATEGRFVPQGPPPSGITVPGWGTDCTSPGSGGSS